MIFYDYEEGLPIPGEEPLFLQETKLEEKEQTDLHTGEHTYHSDPYNNANCGGCCIEYSDGKFCPDMASDVTPDGQLVCSFHSTWYRNHEN